MGLTNDAPVLSDPAAPAAGLESDVMLQDAASGRARTGTRISLQALPPRRWVPSA